MQRAQDRNKVVRTTAWRGPDSVIGLTKQTAAQLQNPYG